MATVPVGDLACLPFFLDDDGRSLFAVHHQPGRGVPVRGHVLCALPFNEEMNRCRSMVTLQARALAERGFGTLVVDLFGTGDSAGEYRDARWDLWLANLTAGFRWLEAREGGCCTLWGIRLGALLVAQLARAIAKPDLRLIYWQPVTDGKLHLTQFLRVRIAAQMDRTDLPKETTASMREQFAAGRCVEIAGYEIHPELASVMDQLRLGGLPPPTGAKTLWLENAGATRDELTPASQQIVSQWHTDGHAVEPHSFAGPAFWQLHERVVAPEIIARTTAWLEASS